MLRLYKELKYEQEKHVRKSRYMRDSACRRLIIENIKIFRSYVEHFWIFPHEELVWSGMVYANKLKYPIMFLYRNNKTKLVAVSFSYFLELLWEKKQILAEKIVIVVTVIISLHYKETN